MDAPVAGALSSFHGALRVPVTVPTRVRLADIAQAPPFRHALDSDPRGAMLASKGRVPVTTSAHPVDRRLWFVSLVLIVAIVAVGIIVNRDSPSHVASPVVVRLAAAVIVTACAAVAKFVAGPRAAAATGVIGTLIAVVLLIQLG